MVSRTTKVTLTAEVAQYIAAMEKAAKATSETGNAAQKLAAQGQAIQQFGRASLAVGTLAAVGVGLAVAKFAEFDSAMSSVQAATHESAANMSALRDAALDAGDRTVFSATEAAGAIEELAKAGLSTTDILNGGLNGALSLAAAGGLEVAEAASVASIAMKQFNLQGSDLPHVADLLAAGAGKAVGDVSDLSAALGQAGLVANGAGHSIEDTTGVLAAFADAGLLGSDAGTSLKSALVALQAPTQKARDVMDEYNLSFYDGNQQMLSFDEIAGQLKTNLGGLGDEQRNAALATIFGNDALRVANVLYDEGAEGIAKYIKQTNDQGYAAETARLRLDNLNGDVEKLGGAMDSTFIKTGSAANDSLRALTQGATGIVSAIGGLPEPVLAAGLGLTGLVGAVGLMGGAALLAVPKVAEFKTALSTLNISGSNMVRTMGMVTAGLAVTGAAFAVWADRQADVAAAAADFQASLDETSGAVTSYTRELAAKKLAEAGVFDAAKEAGISQRELTDAFLEGGDALDAVNQKLTGNNNFASFFTGVGIRAGNAQAALKDLSSGLERSTENFEDEKAAAEGSADVTGEAADAFNTASDRAAQLASNLQGLIDAVNEANGVGQDAVSQNIAYQDALAGVDEHIANARAGIEGYSLGLDQSTQVGRDNMGMLNDLAGNYQSAAAAQFALDGNTTAYTASLQAGREQVLQRARDLGATDEQVQFLSDHIVAMPSEKEIKILAETQAAQAALDRFVWSNDGRTITLTTQVAGMRPTVGNDGGPGGFANGGMLTYANAAGGMYDEGFYQGRPGALYKFAEQETGWEAFISGRPGMEERNRGIALEAYQRLGGSFSAPAGDTYVTNEYHYHSTPIQNMDPHVHAAITAREFGRKVAG